MAQLHQVVFRQALIGGRSRLLCNLSDALRLELDLLPLINLQIADWEPEANARLFARDCVDNLVPDHCQHCLNQIRPTVAHFSDCLETNGYQLFIDNLKRR